METAIELRGVLPPEGAVRRHGYKETEITWISKGIMLMSNTDIEITEDIHKALDMLPEIIRNARVDRSVAECSAWCRRRMKNERKQSYCY